MILDLARFVETERPYWTALEKTLDWISSDPTRKMSIEDLEAFHILYQRASADLAKVATLASEGELSRYLEWLVSRAYSEIHESRDRRRFRPWRWFTVDFPRTFRRHSRAFQFSVALTLAGVAFGVLALRIDSEARYVILPFGHADMSPAERVAREKEEQGRHLTGNKSQFSAGLMTHNTQVALMTIALGMTFGFGTLVLLFYNGVILGAIVYDYIHGGEAIFLMGWLLPHGVIEIPAILVGGQTGLVIAHALIGWGSRISRADRLRAVWGDVVTLTAGAALMLVWAGIVEAFLSQYHEPVVPYGAKIAFGLVEAALLTLFLSRAGAGDPGQAILSPALDKP
jgi:uncharacterized membrane protein SpoIIM required for sporulation